MPRFEVMIPRLGSLVVLVVVVIAGCLGPDPGPERDAADPDGSSADRDAPGPAPPGVPADGEADAPTWALGTWWSWEVTGRGFGSYEVTTVVARTGPTDATVAFTAVQPGLRSHIFHVPPLGRIGRDDHSWIVHDEPAALVDFPLEDGKTWTGTFEGNEIDLEANAVVRDGRTVFEVNGTYAEFEGQGPRYVYDPMLGTFSEIHIHYGGSTPFASARVIDHGTGYTGTVHVPEARDKFLGGAGFPGTSEPVAGFTAAPEKVWLVFGCYMGGSAGQYGMTFVPPSSNEDPLRCQHRHSAEGFASAVDILWRASVPGDWTILFDVAGDGYAFTEVIGVRDEVCRLGQKAEDGGADVPSCS